MIPDSRHTVSSAESRHHADDSDDDDDSDNVDDGCIYCLCRAMTASVAIAAS